MKASFSLGHSVPAFQRFLPSGCSEARDTAPEKSGRRGQVCVLHTHFPPIPTELVATGGLSHLGPQRGKSS